MSEIERYEAPPAAIEKQTDTDSWIQVVGNVAQLAERIAATEFVPRGLRGNVPATAAAILYGREVGLPPMTALSQTHVVEGRPGMSAEAMRALILAAGHEVVVDETTGALCTMRGRRHGSEHWTTVTWTLDMARAAGLTGKNNWKSYPRQMLQARATAELARLAFPDVIHGFRAVEELEDMGADEGPAEAPRPGTSSTVRRRKSTTAKPVPAPPAEISGPPLETDLPPLPDEEPPAPVEPVEEDPKPDEDARDTSPSPAPGAAPPEQPAREEAEQDAAPGASKPSTQAQRRMLFAQIKGLGIDTDDDQERRYIAGRLLGRELGSFTDLTKDDATTLIDTLGRFADKAALWEFLDALDQEQLQLDEAEPVDAVIVEED